MSAAVENSIYAAVLLPKEASMIQNGHRAVAMSSMSVGTRVFFVSPV